MPRRACGVSQAGEEAGHVGGVVEVSGVHVPGGVELLALFVGEADDLDGVQVVLGAGDDCDGVGDVVGGAVDDGGRLDLGVLKAFGEVGAGECGEALAEGELGGGVFGFEFGEFVEDFGGHDFGAGPGEGGEAIGLAFGEGGCEVEVDGVGGDLEVGVGEASEGDVEVAVVAVDVTDLVGDGF